MEPMKPMTPMTPLKPMEPQPRWWPDGLGEPSAAGGQDDLSYAYFCESRRLAVQRGGCTTLYDTGDHLIRGVSQQQHDDGGGATFTSQNGDVRLEDLKTVRR